jgi:hypothetical protein
MTVCHVLRLQFERCFLHNQVHTDEVLCLMQSNIIQFVCFWSLQFSFDFQHNNYKKNRTIRIHKTHKWFALHKLWKVEVEKWQTFRKNKQRSVLGNEVEFEHVSILFCFVLFARFNNLTKLKLNQRILTKQRNVELFSWFQSEKKVYISVQNCPGFTNGMIWTLGIFDGIFSTSYINTNFANQK